MANSKKGWIEYHLNDLFMINPNKEILPDNTDVSFVAMKDISDDGYIISAESKNFADVKNGYTYFKNNDVILAKITPCFENGKMAVVSDLINGAGSTEFFVFRKLPNALVLPKILYYSFKTSKFRENAISHMSGAAGQKRVPKKFLEHYPLYIPPTIEEQQEIVDVLDAASEIIRLRTACIESAQSLIPALFQEMFDISQYSLLKLDEICEIKGGKRLPKGYSLQEEKTEHPYIRVTNFKNNNLDLKDLKYISDEVFEQIKRYTISCNDIYISIAGTIGLVGEIPNELDNANLTENAAKLILKINSFNKKFLIHCLSSGFLQKQISEATVGVGVPKLALIRILNLKLPNVPIEQQELFAAKAQEIEAYIKAQQAELENAKTMFQSLLHHAFTGELTKYLQKSNKRK